MALVCWLLASLVLALVVGSVAARGQELEDGARVADEIEHPSL